MLDLVVVLGLVVLVVKISDEMVADDDVVDVDEDDAALARLELGIVAEE